MEPREHLLGKGVDPVHDRLRPRIRGPCLALLRIGEGQRAEREDLVDLARVEQVTGAFGRHAGVVVHDDRGRQHHVPPARGARQHGERVQVAAVPRGLRSPPGRIQQRQELPVLQRQHAMRGDKGAAEHLGTRRVDGLVAHRVLDEHAQPAQRERRRSVRGRQPQPGRQRPAAYARCDPGLPLPYRPTARPPPHRAGQPARRAHARRARRVRPRRRTPSAPLRRRSDGARRRSRARPPRRTRRRRRFAAPSDAAAGGTAAAPAAGHADSPRTGTRCAVATRPPSPQPSP